jgi:hypothetical protein
MPLRRFECKVCGAKKETLKSGIPQCDHRNLGEDCLGFPEACGMVQILTAPQSKMMEKTDTFHGKSRQKDLTKILRARTRNFARDHEADEMIELNNKNSLERSGFLGKDGKKRKKIDDV